MYEYDYNDEKFGFGSDTCSDNNYKNSNNNNNNECTKSAKPSRSARKMGVSFMHQPVSFLAIF